MDGAVSGIDAIFYTDEEKAVAKQKASDTVLKFWDTIARENTEQSQARRILARMTFQVYFCWPAPAFLNSILNGHLLCSNAPTNSCSWYPPSA